MRDSNLNDALSFVESTYWNITDPRMDGFSTWGLKQQLYQLQFKLQEAIDNSPKYHGEEEWLAEQRTQQAFNLLKK